MKFRHIVKTDAHVLEQCGERNGLDYPRRLWETFVEEYCKTSFLCATEDEEEKREQVRGFIIASAKMVIALVIDAAYRNQGYGGELLRRVLDCPDVVYPISLQVRKSNHGAAKLYAKNGFFKIGTLLNYYQAPQEDAILMECKAKPNPQ